MPSRRVSLRSSLYLRCRRLLCVSQMWDWVTKSPILSQTSFDYSRSFHGETSHLRRVFLRVCVGLSRNADPKRVTVLRLHDGAYRGEIY